MKTSRWLLALFMLSSQTHGTELIRLTDAELQAWADARLSAQTPLQEPLWLAPLVNDSTTATVPLADADSHQEWDYGDLPLDLLDAMLAAQLQASGRYQLQHQPAPGQSQLEVRVVRYQPPYRRGEDSGWWQRFQSRWSSWTERDPQSLAVTMLARWRDPFGQQRELQLELISDSCWRLPHAPAGVGSAGLRVDSERYRHSAIGQATLAGFHRLLAWLDSTQSYDLHRLPVTAVRGQRVRLADPDGLLRTGEELPLFHRDQPDRQIGQLKIVGSHGGRLDAWPLTLAAGSVRPGDAVQFRRPRQAALVVPAQATAGSRCAAAESPRTDHTEVPTEPPDDRPQS